MIGKASLKGYLLEEVIAYLIRNAGYRLLVDPLQDPYELDRQGNGLVVKGRGAVHQADVLGQLAWIPAFTFPIRLFVEAKCRRSKTGLQDVRNAVGVLNDVNQNYFPTRGKTLLQRFSYHYALFSTSGFTSAAANMALAHQISLIDLSGPDFRTMSNFLDELTDITWNDLRRTDDQFRGPRKFLNLLRVYIRSLLGTWPQDIDVPSSYQLPFIESILIDQFNELLNSQVRSFGEFFLAMANGPFLIVLKPSEPEEFLEFSMQQPVHEVIITWTRREGMERQWVIRPAERPNAYSLSFGLPGSLAKWIFQDNNRVLERALNIKQQYFSDITIYRHVDKRDTLFRLIYNADATRRNVRTAW